MRLQPYRERAYGVCEAAHRSKIRLAVARALVFAAALTAEPPAPLAQEVQLKLEHFMPETSPQHRELFLPWARRIEAASKGRIRVNVVPGMGLGAKPSELLDKVVRSEVDISWSLAGYTPERFAKLSVFALPWIASSRAAVTSLALQEFYESHAATSSPMCIYLPYGAIRAALS